MNYKIKRKEIEDAIRQAEMAEGYLVLVTRLSGGRLFHSNVMLNFKREDILPSIEEHRVLLRKELPASSMGETKVEGEKTLPPRYRK